ncbi:MAG: hypothetical protein OXI30_20890 [Chloroflexota bacterium]|nr:hypothetical protein [Chloroflexota bacterium]
MAEQSASLTQRVEALEQISHDRVVERVGQIEQRVSRIESARETEEPHVATKADVARLETLVVETRSDLLQQMGDNHSNLEEKMNAANTAAEKRLRHFLMWLVGAAIALAGVVVAAAAFIVTQLS